MEPLTFKVITDADDSGIKKYDSSLGGLNTTSQKAGAALRSFSRQALEAKSGADLAAAGANALSQAFQKSLFATSVIGGFKIISDQIKMMATLVRDAGQATATAISQVEKLGETTSFEDASKKAGLFQSALDENIKRLSEIQSGNWFIKLQGSITGVTKELEKQNEVLQKNIDAQIAFGMEVEKQKKLRMLGATEEERSAQEIEDKFQKRKEEAQKITNPQLREEAIASAVDISRIEKAELARKMAKKKETEESKKFLEDQKYSDLKRKQDMESYQHELDQQNERTAQESKDFFERIKRGEDLKKESIQLQEKQLDAQDRVNDARRKVVEADAKVANILVSASGTGRGVGQRATSAEIGAQRAAERAGREEAAKQVEQAYKDFKREAEKAGKPSDKYAFNRAQAERLKQQERQRARAPFEEQKRASDDLTSSQTYLSNIQTLLSQTLEDLKSYAMVK